MLTFHVELAYLKEENCACSTRLALIYKFFTTRGRYSGPHLPVSTRLRLLSFALESSGVSISKSEAQLLVPVQLINLKE